MRITEDFLLDSPLARTLYFEHCAGLPIIDMHNHLCVGDLVADKPVSDLASLWVAGDPYKHRAMRINGVPEDLITGDASPKEKFEAWAKTYPYTIGNPLYHFSSLELKRVFGIDAPLSEDTADDIWDRCNAIIAERQMKSRDLLALFNVEALYPCADLLADIDCSDLAQQLVPSLRGDSILAFDPAWCIRLCGGDLPAGLTEFLDAVDARLSVLASRGYMIADHAIDNGERYVGKVDAARVFADIMCGKNVSAQELSGLKSYVLLHLLRKYSSMGWTLLLHVGAERHTSSRLRALAGPAGGYAAIGNSADIRSLCSLLDAADCDGALPKTVLFNLNPSDNAAFATLTGSFSQDGVWGKLQFGPAWWYNDHLSGIEAQLEAVSSYGLLGRFIGMTTDSRSLLSLSRHEYFRRLLCSYVARKAAAGLFDSDEAVLGKLVEDISYYNVKNWLKQ